jgi:calcineurin-like phosphoesterase family protein
MPHLFFTSDEHYGHKNMITYVGRPYKNIEEETRDFINRHNARVTPGMAEHTMTWHLGDLFWNTMSIGECTQIMYALNGSHSLVLGNHDELIEENLDAFKPFFKEIVLYKDMKVSNKQRLTLCHYAMRTWRGSHKGAWQLYGHSHAELPELGQSFDVGVDNPICKFAPLSLDEVRREMEKRKPHHVIKKVWTGKDFPTDHLPEGSH